MIGAGAALIDRFEWVLYIFGVFLIFTGIKMAVHKDSTLDPGELWIVRGFRKLMPITDDYREKSFFVRENGRFLATPLSGASRHGNHRRHVRPRSIPAIFAVTKNAFIVYTSNVFAILGLRSLYFLLAGIMPLFRYLKFGLSAACLVFVGVKMLLGHTDYAIPIDASFLSPSAPS